MMSGPLSRNSYELLPQHQLMSGSVPALSGRDPGTVIRPPDPIDVGFYPLNLTFVCAVRRPIKRY